MSTLWSRLVVLILLSTMSTCNTSETPLQLLLLVVVPGQGEGEDDDQGYSGYCPHQQCREEVHVGHLAERDNYRLRVMLC